MAIYNVDDIVDRLNDYGAIDHTDEWGTPEGNIWQDVVVKLPGYDAEATEAADPGCASDVIVLTDGTEINYIPSAGEWQA